MIEVACPNCGFCERNFCFALKGRDKPFRAFTNAWVTRTQGVAPGLNYDTPLGLFDAPAIQTCDKSRLPADSVTHPTESGVDLGYCNHPVWPVNWGFQFGHKHWKNAPCGQ